MHSRCVSLVTVLGCVVAPAAAGGAVWGDGVADLIYLPGTGNVVLWPEDASGALVCNYVLLRDSGGFVEENTLFPNGNTYATQGVGDVATDTEVSWTDVDYINLGAPPDLTATFDSGAILPAGLTEVQLGSWFSRSTFVGQEGTGEGNWNLSHGYADVTNDVTMTITGGSKTVGSITGSGTLSIADGATVQLEQKGTVWLDDNTQANLTLNASGTSGGTLDLTKNRITLASETEADVLDMVKNACNGGAWDRPGVTSSSITDGTRAVGVTDEGVTGVLAGFTVRGDANMDLKVSAGDLGLLSGSWGTTSGATWDMGDSNYDGAVSPGDLGALAGNWGTDLAHAPEPASVALLAVGGAALLRRRRR